MPVWQIVTVAFSERRVSSSGSARAAVIPRPITTTCAPAIGTPYRRQQLDAAARRARQRRRLAEREPAEVGRVQPVGVLGRVDPGQHRVGRRRPGGSGSWTRYAVQAGSAFSSSTTASTSAWVAVAGSSTPMLRMPTSAQSRCLPRTYAWLAGSSPTSTVPSPGSTPRSRSASMRAFSSPRMVAAVALPSRRVAVTATMLRRPAQPPGRPPAASSAVNIRTISSRTPSFSGSDSQRWYAACCALGHRRRVEHPPLRVGEPVAGGDAVRLLPAAAPRRACRRSRRRPACRRSCARASPSTTGRPAGIAAERLRRSACGSPVGRVLVQEPASQPTCRR